MRQNEPFHKIVAMGDLEEVGASAMAKTAEKDNQPLHWVYFVQTGSC